MQKLQDVFLVSDGIMVQFEDGLSCYFPASFLLEQAGAPPSQIFTLQDPSAAGEDPLTHTPAAASPEQGLSSLLQ